MFNNYCFLSSWLFVIISAFSFVLFNSTTIDYLEVPHLRRCWLAREQRANATAAASFDPCAEWEDER